VVLFEGIMALTGGIVLFGLLLAASGQPDIIRQRAACRNRLHAAYVGFLYYADQYATWMAPWDQHTPAGIPADRADVLQWPYTMSYYVEGSSLPAEEAAYTAKGWYNPQGSRLADHPFAGPRRAVALQCPTLAARGAQWNPRWNDFTGYSYAVIGWHRESRDEPWVYTEQDYPKPDLLTHPATTVLLMDIVQPPDGGDPVAWTAYERTPSDPHGGESNYLLTDGHSESLEPKDITPVYWQSLWERAR